MGSANDRGMGSGSRRLVHGEGRPRASPDWRSVDAKWLAGYRDWQFRTVFVSAWHRGCVGDRTSRWLAEKDAANLAAFDARPEKVPPELGPNGIALVAQRAVLGGFGTKMRPFLVLDEASPIPGYWGTTFHPLNEGLHTLSVWFSYRWRDARVRFGLATSTVLVGRGEWQRVDYFGPSIAKRLRRGRLVKSLSA